MNQEKTDALVFFGATGDLAHKKIFPALQALAKRGNLDMPVIGAAKAGWTPDQLKQRARDSVENYGGLDPEAFAQLSRCATLTATMAIRRPFNGCAGNWATQSIRCTISPSRRVSLRPSFTSSASQVAPRARASSLRSLSVATLPRRGR